MVRTGPRGLPLLWAARDVDVDVDVNVDVDVDVNVGLNVKGVVVCTKADIAVIDETMRRALS